MIGLRRLISRLGQFADDRADRFCFTPPQGRAHHFESPLPPAEVEAFVSGLDARDVVVIDDSENSDFDVLKLALSEHHHLSRYRNSPRARWIGGPGPIHHVPPPKGRMPLLVSFFTPGTQYEEHADRLRRSIDALGLPARIEARESRGTWEQNCAIKPEFVLDKLRESKGPVLWVDCDAVVRSIPSLLIGARCDFAIHKVHRWCFASGTVFFNYTDPGLELCEEWTRLCQLETDSWDQEVLDSAWGLVAGRRSLHTTWLPEEYTTIFDRDHQLLGPVVIEHYQASRAEKAARGYTRKSPARRTAALRLARAASRVDAE